MSLGAQHVLTPLISVVLKGDPDVVTARRRAREISAVLGFSRQDQVRIATAVSEIARNASEYGGGGRVDFSLSITASPQSFQIKVVDSGPGIQGLNDVLQGRYRSATGMGIGLAGARRLMDDFYIESEPGRGTVVRMSKALPATSRSVAQADLQRIVAELAENRGRVPVPEVHQQNQELLETLEALRERESELERRQVELSRLNIELEETNRGVVALYGELDERALALRRADELKSRFLSHVSHEFRTPVNSIVALARLLLQRADGDLTDEQERQVGYIRQSAEDLADLVNDLLDLAKVESGKIEICSAPFEIVQLFSGLRGIMRPLATGAVRLVFEDPPPGLWIDSDESKISQIMRNLLSNALKFTEQGEVRVACRLTGPDCRRVAISVFDTGIGISAEDQPRIFDEFAQVHHAIQRKVKGTGLGLPLSRKLATLLGGTLEVSSTPGAGSEFRLTLPVGPGGELGGKGQEPESGAVLIVDDDETARYLAKHVFRGLGRAVIESNGLEAAERARFEKPMLIVLDLMMPDRNGFDVLDDLKSNPETASIPVIIHTSKMLGLADLDRLGGRHAAILPKEMDRAAALAVIGRVFAQAQER